MHLLINSYRTVAVTLSLPVAGELTPKFPADVKCVIRLLIGTVTCKLMCIKYRRVSIIFYSITRISLEKTHTKQYTLLWSAKCDKTAATGKLINDFPITDFGCLIFDFTILITDC